MLRFFPLLFLPLLSFSQNDLSLNMWATHLPFNNAESVVDGKNFIYYATNKAILRVSKEDFAYQKLSKTEGLSDADITTIFFHKNAEDLVICYKSGLIDIISSDNKISNADIVNFNNIPIDKTIQSVSQFDTKSILINASYGVSQLNLENGRFTFTLFTPNIPIISSARIDNKVFILSKNAVFLFDEKTKGVIQDFGKWVQLNENHGLPAIPTFTSMTTYKDKLYLSTPSTIYQYDGNKFISWYSPSDVDISKLNGQAQHLFVTYTERTSSLRGVIAFGDQPDPVYLSKDCVENNLDLAQSEDGKVWLADNRWGFRYINDINSSCNIIFVPGPFQPDVYEIGTFSDGNYFASGGVKLNYLPLFNASGVMKFANNNWTIYNHDQPDLIKFKPFLDVLRIREHPDKTKLYFGSYGQGVLELDKQTNSYVLFNASNSLLTGVEGDSTIVRVVGMDFDKNKTLWIATYAGTSSIFSYDKNKEWKRHPFNKYLFTDLKVDKNGYVWASIRDGGILVYDPVQNQQILLNSANTELTTNDIRCIEVDLEGDVWVGTAEGPVVFECGSSVFSGDCKGNRRKVDQDGIIFFLLSSEVIRTIAVDGANRKWFGTSNNGVYVQSPSGEDQIYYFNSKNSPLLDDNISDIAIDPKNGYAWIATAKGLQVFRSDATGATNTFSINSTVFPNPVPPDYDGLIAINGLARDAKVKITDLSGRLVFETSSNGGQAIWNGYDYLGRKASSGVYLVFANSTQDFEQTEGFVTKIVIAK